MDPPELAEVIIDFCRAGVQTDHRPNKVRVIAWVMYDRVDLASLYGVSTKRLNEQVKRNRHRFPLDFMFQLSAEANGEYEVANCDLKQRTRWEALSPICLHRARSGARDSACRLATCSSRRLRRPAP
jgi:hypothetical protein